MARALNTEPTPIRQRARTPGTVARPTAEMVNKAQDAFYATKQANAAASAARKATSELAKLMAKAGIDVFTFQGETPTGSTVPVRAAIEPIPTDVIDVNVLRTLVDDATFMRVIKATKGDVENECGSHIVMKATATIEKPAELKIKEVK